MTVTRRRSPGSDTVLTGAVQAMRALVSPRIVISRLLEDGALPVIMSIIGPREPYDYRELNLGVPGSTISMFFNVLLSL